MLPADEVMEHMEFAIPHSWQKQMILQGFNTIEHNMDEFLEFCKRLKTAENIFDFMHKKTQKGKSETRHTKDPGPQVDSGRQNKGKNEKHLLTYFTVYTTAAIPHTTQTSAM